MKSRFKLIFVLACPAVTLLAPAQNQIQSPNLTDRLVELQGNLERSSGESLLELLNRRKALFSQVMRTEPALALAHAISPSLRQRLAGVQPEADALIERAGSWQGPVSVIVGDDFETGKSKVHLRIASNSGSFSLHLVDPPPDLVSGRWLQVGGIQLGSQVAGRILNAESGTVCSPTGEMKTAVIVVDYPDLPFPQSYVSKAELRDLFFSGSRPSVSGYYREVSQGRTWLTGDVYGPLLLDKRYRHAIEDFESIATAAIRTADTLIDFRAYNRVVLLLPDEAEGLFSPLWSGAGTVGCVDTTTPGKGRLNLSFSLISVRKPVARDMQLFISTHEFGHNLGTGHANTLDYSPLPLGAQGTTGKLREYGDLYSVMGNTAAELNGWLMGQMSAPHKARLGWLEAGSGYRDVENGATLRLVPISAPSAGLKAVRVRRGPGSPEWLWMEYRQPLGFDESLKLYTKNGFSGLLIHYEHTNPPDPRALLSTSTYLLDFNPEPPGSFWMAPSFGDAALDAGRTWVDPFSTLSIAVGAASASGIDVTIRYTPPCATISQTIREHSGGAESSSFAVSAPSYCNWTATSTVEWITVKAGSAGSGAGTVSYTLTPNRTRQPRTGYLVVGLQTITIGQASGYVNELPVPVSLNPASGVGSSALFRVAASDANGADDLYDFGLVFSAANGFDLCTLIVQRDPWRLSVNDDQGRRFVSAALNTPATVQNGYCAADAASVEVTHQGNVQEATVPVIFATGFPGTFTVDFFGRDQNQTLVRRTMGTWTVPASSCTARLDKSQVDFRSDGGRGDFRVTVFPGCPWIASSRDSWISISQKPLNDRSATVTFSADPNRSPIPRIGAVTAAGKTVTVIQAGSDSGRVAIAENGVFNAASPGSSTGIASSAWITIRGSNLSRTTRTWSPADFQGNVLPTVVDGVSVRINGKAGYVQYVSPTQINALAPDDDAEGPVSVQVLTPQGVSNPIVVDKWRQAPALFNYTADGRKFVAAVHTDGVLVGPADVLPGGTTRPARPGETILLFGTGFGPTDPIRPAAELISQPAPLAAAPRLLIGTAKAGVTFSGLVSSGLYQINFTVPDLADGEYLVSASFDYGGFGTPVEGLLAVGR